MAILWLIFSAFGAHAQDSGPARILPSQTSLISDGYKITLTLAFSRAIPYRVFALDSPRRLILDFAEVDFTFIPNDLADDINQVSDMRFGFFRPQESRLVFDLAEPFIVASAEFSENFLTVVLSRSDEETFKRNADQAAGNWVSAARAEPSIQGAAGLPLIALDAGHGGIDPGASRGDITEKQVTLHFAKQLRDDLLATGRYRVLMTREDDTFQALPERIRLARASHADVFISLHANTVERGNARGTSVYNLSEEASNDEAANRAAFENRSDIVAGAVLLGQDDQIAQVLIEMAQRETNARSVRFADTLGSTIRFALDSGVPSRRLAANFRVLRAVDTPSVLIELGFMSNATDLANLMASNWRHIANQSIIAALDEWFINIQ